MKNNAALFTAVTLTIAGLSEAAFAQQTPYYTWNIINETSGQIGQDKVPTQTGMSTAPWLTPYQVSSNGATMDATASPTAPAATGTAFVGGEFKVGIFWYEMECGFTISGGSGTCNAPTPSPFVSSGNGGSPKCTVESVQQTDTCKYTVNFKMTLP